MREPRATRILSIILVVACSAAAQVPRQGGSPPDVPPEFRFLYEGGIKNRFGLAELHAMVPARSWDNYARLFPEKSGDFTGRVDIWNYARLCYLLSTSHFSNMSDRYAANWTDDRTVVVTATANGKTKVVSEYGGVGPSELWGIQAAIDSIAQRVAWMPN